jgi:4-amino-4-deoxy-L-arabinose transferase-like glycosyltransferase
MISNPKVLPHCYLPLVLLLLLVASAILLFCRLGDIEMRPWDESLYALRAKEMYYSGHFLAPMQGGKVAWSSGKPPLGYWLILLSFHLLGLNPLALRLPFALAGVGCVFLLFMVGQQIGDRRLGLFSALALLLMPGFLDYSRRAILEPLLTFFFLAALLLFHQSHRCTTSKSILYSFASGLAIGLAILTKQVVGLVILPALLIYEIYHWRCRGGGGHLARSGSLLLATVVTSVWWFLIMYGQYGSTFLQSYFGTNVFRRLTHTITAVDRMAQGFHSVLLQRTGTLPLLLGISGLLMIIFLLGSRSSQRIRPPLKQQGRSLLVPFLLFSAVYYLIYGLLARTLLSWYPFPLLPILGLGQGYLLWTYTEASPHREAGCWQSSPLLLLLLTSALALSQRLYWALLLLVPLLLLGLLLLRGGSPAAKVGIFQERKASYFSALGLSSLFLFFALSAHLALQGRTYRSPDPFKEVAAQVEAARPREVLFDANIDAGLRDKIYPLRFYLDVPVRKAQVESYLRGDGAGKGKMIITSRARWMALRGTALGGRPAQLLPGNDLVLLETR